MSCNEFINDDFIKYKMEYHDGYYSAGNNIPYDKNKSELWKEGYKDGYYSLYDEEYQEK